MSDDKDLPHKIYDYNGQFIKNFYFDKLQHLSTSDEYFIGVKNDKIVLMNSKMKECYLEQGYILNSDNTILFKKDNKWGLKTVCGEKRTNAVYDSMFAFRDGLALVKKQGKLFYIDKKGKEYCE